MAVVLRQTMPGDMLEMLDAVTDEMGVEASPPSGLIVHTHFVDRGATHIVDVWESADAYERFRDERLMPAMEKVAAARGVDLTQAGQPDTSLISAHRYVTGP